MIHLTLSGYGPRASRTLCQGRGASIERSDVHYHAAYCSDVFLRRSDICPECKQVWLCDEQDDDNSEEL